MIFFIAYQFFAKKSIMFFIVWHPRCGPCPANEIGAILDGSAVLGSNHINGNITDTECDRSSNSVLSEMQVSDSSFKLVCKLII